MSAPALGSYRPGHSLLHRAPAGVKLAGLVGLALLLVWWSDWWQTAAVLGAVVTLYPLCRLPVASIWVQLTTLIWVLGVLAVFQVVVAGWRTGVGVTCTVLALVLAAGAVTLTTTTTALSDVVVALLRPLKRFGVAPERLALLISLSIRSVAVVAGLAQDVRDAQRARGLTASPRAYAVPLLVRSLRHAERLGEALVARGFDD